MLDSRSPVGKVWALWVGFVVYLLAASVSWGWLGANVPAGEDLKIYLTAAERATAGENPYAPYAVGLSFMYHPITLLAIGWLPTATSWFSLVWGVASALAWIGAVSFSLAIARSGREGSQSLGNKRRLILVGTIAAVGYAPFVETLYGGQVNTFVALLMCAAFWFAERRKDWIAGACLGLSAAIKISPALLVVHFVSVRQYRVALAFAVTLILCTLASSLFLYPSVVFDFGETVARLRDETAPSAWNASLLSNAVHLMNRVGSENALFLPTLIHRGAFLISVLTLVVLNIGKRLESGQRAWSFVAFVMLSVVFSPLVWYHHAVLLVLPLVMLFFQGGVLCALGAASLLLIQFERPFETFVRVSPIPMLVGQLLLIVAIVLSFSVVRLRSS